MQIQSPTSWSAASLARAVPPRASAPASIPRAERPSGAPRHGDAPPGSLLHLQQVLEQYRAELLRAQREALPSVAGHARGDDARHAAYPNQGESG